MTIAQMKELALHAARGTAPTTFSVENVNAALLDAMKALGGSVNQFMKNRYDIYEIISGSGDISGIGALQLSLNYIIKNFDDKTFDILMNAILAKQSTNQSSQDDLVR